MAAVLRRERRDKGGGRRLPGSSGGVPGRDDGLWMDAEGRWEVGMREGGVKGGTLVSGWSNWKEGADKEQGGRSW